jgi:primase-polymerase (primpol)-like protein
VATVDTYCELSPSGRGIRFFGYAKLPAAGRKRGNVELYDDGRFLTVTGRHLAGTPTTIENRQDEILAVHAKYDAPPERKPQTVSNWQHSTHLGDRDLPIRALRAKNGEKFARLWSGDTSAYGGDHSAGDLALAFHLRFWCGRDAAAWIGCSPPDAP